MENSSKIAFSAENSKGWYVAAGEEFSGPHDASEIQKKLDAKEINPAFYVWRKGEDNWSRICNHPVFKPLAPKRPSRNLIDEVIRKKSKVDKIDQVRQWYLYYSQSQYGPFSTEEVLQFLDSGRIQSDVYTWKEGMSEWKPLQDISTFEGVRGRPPLPKEKKDKRSTPRKPLIAKVIMASGSKMDVGMCRDVSVGGMQILVKEALVEVGARITLNVTSSDGKEISPFVAEGEVVRILEDGRGFSIRFSSLPPDSKRAIESYLS